MCVEMWVRLAVGTPNALATLLGRSSVVEQRAMLSKLVAQTFQLGKMQFCEVRCALSVPEVLTKAIVRCITLA